MTNAPGRRERQHWPSRHNLWRSNGGLREVVVAAAPVGDRRMMPRRLNSKRPSLREVLRGNRPLPRRPVPMRNLRAGAPAGADAVGRAERRKPRTTPNRAQS
jgi:hypothetical protein